MILHIPHSSTSIPERYPTLPPTAIEMFTDWYTDELFEASSGEAFVFPYSRFYVDVERLDPDPLDQAGNGLFYTHVPGSHIQYRDKSLGLDAARSIYDEWHASIISALYRHLTHSERVVLVDCHSFSDEQTELAYPDKIGPFADICIGHNDLTSGLLDIVVEGFEQQGLSVSINEPYSNSLQPIEGKGFESIMIELNKRTYLTSGATKNGSFKAIQIKIQRVLHQIDKYERFGYV